MGEGRRPGPQRSKRGHESRTTKNINTTESLHLGFGGGAASAFFRPKRFIATTIYQARARMDRMYVVLWFRPMMSRDKKCHST